MERIGYRRILLVLPVALAGAGAAIALSSHAVPAALLAGAASPESHLPAVPCPSPLPSPSPQLGSSVSMKPTSTASGAANPGSGPEIIIPSAGPTALEVSQWNNPHGHRRHCYR